MDEYIDTRYCGVCEKDTKQTRIDSEHERDSSADYGYCHECGSVYSGYTGKWRKPTNQEEVG